MNWTNLIKQFRLSRGLNQAVLAELCGVQQATISRWEAGKSVPDRAMRNRLRAILHAQNSKMDQAILRSVHYAHTCSGLALTDPPRVIEASLAGCQLQGIRHADVVKIPLFDWFMHFSRAREIGPANHEVLKNGDILAIQVTTELPIFRTGEKIPVTWTSTPLWFSDGTFVLRGDASILPLGEYQGQSVTVITHDDMACEP